MHGRVAGWLATITTIRQPLFRGARGCGFGKLSSFQQPSVKISCFSAIIGPETAGRKSTEENAVGSRIAAVSSKTTNKGSKKRHVVITRKQRLWTLKKRLWALKKRLWTRNRTCGLEDNACGLGVSACGLANNAYGLENYNENSGKSSDQEFARPWRGPKRRVRPATLVKEGATSDNDNSPSHQDSEQFAPDVAGL